MESPREFLGIELILGIEYPSIWVGFYVVSFDVFMGMGSWYIGSGV